MVAYPEEPFFASDSVRLDVSFGEPGRQSRWSVAFRGLLVIPQLLALFALGLAGRVLVVIGWFAALAIGRLPRWIAEFELEVIAYTIRVNAYTFFLVDEYPPFAFSVDDYPIAVQAGASRLSRAKVFFRLLLAIPAGFVAGFAWYGLIVLSPVIWLVTLVLGRTPQSLFSAAAAVTRYQARYSAYMGLVTDEYPHALFGDDELAPMPDWVSDTDQERRRVVRVSLSDGAKWVMRLIIVLGIAAEVTLIVLLVELRPTTNPALGAAENNLIEASDIYETSVPLCRSSADPLECVQNQDRAWGEAFHSFASSLSRIKFSTSQASEASALAADARNVGDALVARSHETTLAGYTKATHKVDALLPTLEADAKILLGHGL